MFKRRESEKKELNKQFHHFNIFPNRFVDKYYLHNTKAF